MRSTAHWRLALGAALAVAVGLAGCGEPGVRRYEAVGVVEDVRVDERQVLIAHEDIPGLMPAMTMNFEVPDAALAASLEPGHVIDFSLEFDGHSYRVVAAEVRDRVEPREGYARLGNKLLRADPAPDFELVDQDGDAFGLAGLRGRAVLLDFVYTRCPGPCPILTSLHVDVQRSLPEDLREAVHFVSISLDPAFDTPAVLGEYAGARGADLAGWSFLTGEPAAVQEVVRAYGVGSLRRPDGEIDHVVASFLIDREGRIVRRYLGLEHEVAEIRRDLLAVGS
ncbi:MAG: SCO family protein [Myxococcota bacterium]